MRGSRIEYVQDTYNPVTGCRYQCPYCYARRIATRFGARLAPEEKDSIFILDRPARTAWKNGKETNAPFPYGFAPTLHRYRLDEIRRKRKGGPTLVCSMADLFGPWVPDEWIFNVFDSCQEGKGPFLFLTKNPGRYGALADAGNLPSRADFWYGTSIPIPGGAWFSRPGYQSWVSVEPLLGPFHGPEAGELAQAGWIVIGAETGNRAGKIRPDRSWVRWLVEERRKAGKPTFLKDSMKNVWGADLPTETPWEGAGEDAETERVPGKTETGHRRLEKVGAGDCHSVYDGHHDPDAERF